MKTIFFEKEIEWYLQEIKKNLTNLDFILSKEIFKVIPTYEFIYDKNSEYEEDEANAFVKCLDYENHKYQIILGDKLFKYLYNYVQSIEINNIFKDTKFNIDMKYKYSSILLIWFNFICCHELSHIINGHLLFLKNKYPKKYLSEFNMVETIDKELSKDILMLEVDADRLASLLSVYFFSFSIKRFSKFFRLKNKDSIYIYSSSIIYLFDALDELNNREDFRVTHPSALERMTLINPILSESFLNYNFTSKYKTNKYIYDSLKEYAIKSPNVNIKRLESILTEGLIGYEYDKFITDVNLKQYNYLKENLLKIN